jgi:hypothetical protein
MNTPVNFEIAKLLKAKGFDEITNYNYSEVYGYIENINALKHSDGNNRFVSAPTISEVVMWLYEKYGIWISVQPNEPYVDNDWCFTIFKDFVKNTSLEGYDSQTEAYEAGIIYALNNLI